ncbi:hypothetical protein F0U60_32195 [Archangium minus]|uniref:VWA7 N-terminal domain-containing protein n=1 Tax=Archangium minus TaxID=83450 RepID=A0ABY9WYQ0_9BACT|nr:hypothetical protein F0U60_32195 [Archangium minus]
MKLRLACAYATAVLFVLPPPILAADKSGNKAASSAQERPNQLSDDWKGLIQFPTSSQRVWSAKDQSGFGLGDHHALAEKGGTICSEQLVAAQYRQDIQKQFDATAHFDNCVIEGSFQALDTEITEINKILSAPSDKKAAAQKAMSHIGRILHAVQDFYAHTNWVELQHSAGTPFDNATVSIWTEEGRKRVRDTKNLVSGYVWWSRTPSQCESDKVTHAILAKDSSSTQGGKVPLLQWKRSAYMAAFTLAQRSTGAFLEWAYGKWPLLAQQCGNELYVVVTPDRRPE